MSSQGPFSKDPFSKDPFAMLNETKPKSGPVPLPPPPMAISPAAEKSEPTYHLGDVSGSDFSRPVSRPRASKAPWLVALLATGAAAGFGWYAYFPARTDAEAAKRELETTRRASQMLQQQVDALKGSQQELAAEVERREKELASLQSTQDELAKKLDAEIQKGNVLIKQVKGELVVDLVDKILFDSGLAELNDQGKQVLRSVGETFLKVPDKVIQVSGHTDAVPISEKLVEKFPSNWELSTARATQVVRFLQDEVKMPGKRLIAAGCAEYKPVASNATKTGRKRNRRIEVTLLPLK